MKRDESASVVTFLTLAVILLFGVYGGLWSLSELFSLLPYFIMAGMVGVLIWGFRRRIEDMLKGTNDSSSAGEIMMQRLKRLQNEARLDRLRDRMQYVYGPLHSAVVSMREGKDAVPKGYTVGTPLNAWSKYPEIMQRIIDVFSKYPNLVENERVWKGWTQKEHELREEKFWLGAEVYEWFDAIEDEYNQLDSELKPTPVERQYSIATLKFRIWSTTNWIEIGLVDSRHVTIKNYDMGKGSIRSVDEPNNSHLRIEVPAAEISVTATFEVYSGPLFIFTRKGDYGTLKADVLSKNGEKIWEIPEYGTTDKKYNYLEQPGFDFNDWD